MLKKQHYAKKLAFVTAAVKDYIGTMKRDLESARQQLEAALREAERLAANCTDAQWRWSPAPGVWSAGECIAHLNQTNRAYALAIHHALDSGNPERSAALEFKYGVLERWFVKSLEPPVKMKGKAPKVFLPLAVDNRESTLAEWQRIQVDLTSLTERSEPLHLRRVKVVSPFSRFIKISLGTAFAMLAAHNRRHLWQAGKMISGAKSAGA